jgi:glycosyltransferase involved in cell wall biosynthesis
VQLPRLSVVTPSYNQRRFLAETLDSVLGQRADVHEYFVLDGGSNDGSRDLIESYASRLNFWVSASDGGQSAAIDRGLRMATGDVVCWINSDDVFLPGALRMVREAFARDPGLDVVHGWCVHIDEHSQIIHVRRPPAQTLQRARWGIIHVSQQATFFRRRLYEAVGGLDLSLHCVMDTELWYRMLERPSRWGFVPAILAGFRLHDDAKGRSWLDQYAKEHELMRARYPQFAADTLRHRVGLLAHRVIEVGSLRYIRDRRLSRRVAGRPLAELGAHL